MEPNSESENIVKEFSQQSDAICSELSRLREVSDSNQSEAVSVLEETLQVLQKIESRIEASDEMLNKGMSLIFWVQLATLAAFLAMGFFFLL
ncbi:MAG: hypothetical protein CL917_03130 [Deltaproteobacteria bacterium]|nr:hypothetical protein [Deltaproteobacteria bacterium]